MNKTITKIAGVLTSPKGTGLGLLPLRLGAGAMMLTHGLAKLTGYTAMATAFPDHIGIGAQLSFTLIMLAEFIGAILLMLGLFTRLAALSLSIGMAVAAFIAHAPFSVSDSELPLLYLVVFIVLLVSGGGRYSVDHYIYKSTSKTSRK